jgi:hypothetical protein
MKALALLDSLIVGAQSSSFGLKKLNVILQRVIPFNRPHRIRITSVSDDEIRTTMPYRKSNLNHLKGMHACGIATLAEYTSGIFLLQKAKSSGYRLIMKSIHVEYHYQAKSAVHATFGLDEAAFDEKVRKPLAQEGVLLDDFIVKVYDTEENHIATATMEWQLKDWKKTKYKAN